MATFQTNPWLRKVSLSLGVLTLGAGAVLLPACGNNGRDIVSGRENITTEDYAQTTQISDAIGQEATIRSSVIEPLDANGLILQAEGGENVLVLNISTNGISLPDGDVPIQVTGQVVEFTIADVEADYGLDLNETLYTDYEEQPAILADSWALAPTPEMLAEQPERFYNQRIALEGDASIISPDALALYEDGWIDDVGILVVGVEKPLMEAASTIQEGESVAVTGIAQPLEGSMLKGEYDLGLTDQQIEEFASRYTNRPVIVADTIYPTAVDD
jgi:hypothetical protein